MTKKVREITFEGPRFVFIPRKTMADKKISVNMNTYRNLHFHESAAVKKIYTELMRDQMEGRVLETPCHVTYKVYHKTAGRLDKMNVISITSKFMLDAMSTYGVIEDDNDQFIKQELLLETEKDKDNPRVVVTFKTVEENL